MAKRGIKPLVLGAVLLALLGRRYRRTFEVEAPAAAVEEDHHTKTVVDAAVSTIRRARWWVPGPLAIASIVTAVALTWANSYYHAYYLAFGLSMRQAGLDRSEILFRLLPLGVVFTALLFVLVFIVQFTGATSKTDPASQQNRRSVLGAPGSVRDRFAGAGLTMSLVVVAMGLFLGVLFADGWMKESGKQDARRFVTSPFNAYYQGGWQAIFDTKSGASTLHWIGTPAANPFEDRPDDGSDEPQTAARIIVQNDGVTAYLDLYDCDVHIVPTNSVIVTYDLTDYAAGPPAMLSLPACKSTI